MDKAHIRRMGKNLLISAVVLACILTAMAVADKAATTAQPRADIIAIDGLKAYGPLERPAVPFLHSKHTEALSKEKKDCLTCHPAQEKRLSLKFKRTEDQGKKAIMDIYHAECIACHKELRAAGKISGPVTCGGCHTLKNPPPSSWQPIGLDKSLHQRHVTANEKKCELCHHEYNAQTKKLFYAKGQEGACLYCHKERTEENRIANRPASHLACIGCHRDRIAQKKPAGPIECGGCHDSKQQALIEKVKEPIRIERNQPDAVLVKSVSKDQALPADQPLRQIAGVAFNHKGHENYTNNCRGCHHAGLQSCAACHSLQGRTEGKMVKLAQAMHQKEAGMSCIGCHNKQKTQPQCAGCHHSIPPSRSLTTESTCRTCHSVEQPENPSLLTDEQNRAKAADLVAARKPIRSTLASDQIPETVTIKKLVDKYQAAVMPHRKIVLKLAEANQKSQLAAFYHTDPLTLCQGCHHNSPATAKPPQCGSCHGRSSEALNLTRPGLMAAYHQQCIECHTEMGLEKPAARDCTACHAKRN